MSHSLTLGQKIKTKTYCIGCRQIQDRYFDINTLTPDPIHTFKCGLPIPLRCKKGCDTPDYRFGYVNPNPRQTGHLCMCRYCRFDSYLRIDYQFSTKVIVPRLLGQPEHSSIPSLVDSFSTMEL